MPDRKNAARGARYKGKTKKWLEEQGYQVAHMEMTHFIFTPKGRIGIKRDQFASDLLAMKPDALIFAQVKFGSPDLPETLRKFSAYKFPTDLCSVWLVVWKLRAREPQVIDLTAKIAASYAEQVPCLTS